MWTDVSGYDVDYSNFPVGHGEKSVIVLLRSGLDLTDDEIIAIGPVVMMKAVADITKKIGIATSVSLNPIMIDGTGMCGGCRVTIAGNVKFACVDGPDFNGFEVDFDELIRRQSMYKKEEEEHKCRIGAGK